MKNEAGEVFAKMVEAVPVRELSADAVKAIVRESGMSQTSGRSGETGRSRQHGERSSLPLAVAALALFVLVPALSAGWSGPTLAERAEAAYVDGLFAQYGSVIFDAIKQGAAAKTGGL